jgi:hypothetical protein
VAALREQWKSGSPRTTTEERSRKTGELYKLQTRRVKPVSLMALAIAAVCAGTGCLCMRLLLLPHGDAPAF